MVPDVAKNNDFLLHPTLAVDCFVVGDLPLCRVLLMNQASFPWLILVPRIADVVELTHLPEKHYLQAVQEIRHSAEVLEALYQPYKLNIAALGNQVRQLHIHLIARFESDVAWPNAVWGWERTAYDETLRKQRITELQHALKIT
jgi:diadenosine tetraphosphate (Ap4A) HIT family hydrolase